ncbi:hypothetical protein GTA08_BOTSDO04278 [Botryosphaeria dothidea]|uniref:NAD(P)-binding protein n=1 Tax=Botryosphaeria dothidea TaxID=55169 RepID=A0A8H4IV22_9PEZI|nr:hypothetical protein GTA08_BOTSDO04278 [Botryosphaeria dothidea]
MAFLPLGNARHFVASRSPEEIAKRMREDAALVDADERCSWIAFHLPQRNTSEALAIATHLVPSPGLSDDVKNLVYENLVSKLRRHLGQDGPPRNEPVFAANEPPNRIPISDLATALKVLTHLQHDRLIEPSTSVSTLASWLQKRTAPPTPPDTPEREPTPTEGDKTAKPAPAPPPPPRIPRKRLCYICRLAVTHPHPTHPSLCLPCGAFNLSRSQLSTPPRLALAPTFTALVTGARVNLGYRTALRLLRCGARVIATTRYPRDAVARYGREGDYEAWKARLKVVGADFRSARDAFEVVGAARRCLREWAGEGEGRLDLLVNNAAQTLTDSVSKERGAVRREEELEKEVGEGKGLIEGSYRARVRGGAVPVALEGVEKGMTGFEGTEERAEMAGVEMPLETANGACTEIETYTKSSWVQSLFEIPYEDVISAHAVNTFVPLILCRELLPLMGGAKDPSGHSDAGPLLDKPEGYIINVSSREGIFEDRTNSTAKGGKHVHTNMSKAALNMITETESATAWQTRRVAMNTVDPGYMSAAPEYEDAFDGIRPIGWEDGAGRVLWPVSMGEMEGEAIWGRFLKHYGAVHVDPGAGRG